jgi:hypothetical protein
MIWVDAIGNTHLTNEIKEMKEYDAYEVAWYNPKKTKDERLTESTDQTVSDPQYTWSLLAQGTMVWSPPMRRLQAPGSSRCRGSIKLQAPGSSRAEAP